MSNVECWKSNVECWSIALQTYRIHEEECDETLVGVVSDVDLKNTGSVNLRSFKYGIITFLNLQQNQHQQKRKRAHIYKHALMYANKLQHAHTGRHKHNTNFQPDYVNI